MENHSVISFYSCSNCGTFFDGRSGLYKCRECNVYLCARCNSMASGLFGDANYDRLSHWGPNKCQVCSGNTVKDDAIAEYMLERYKRDRNEIINEIIDQRKEANLVAGLVARRKDKVKSGI